MIPAYLFKSRLKKNICVNTVTYPSKSVIYAKKTKHCYVNKTKLTEIA